jgi:hypothetical protein
MRPEIWAMTALLLVPTTGQQRGVVNGVVVPKAPVQAGLPVDITINGTNPCGAVRVDPGDGTERITHPITQVPTTVRYVYRKAGRFQVRAEGMGNCDGAATTTIQVNPAPAQMTGQQRGVVRGVAVPKTPVQAGQPVDITITGANPCGAVRVDPGDGTERITHPITQVPTTVRYVYRKAGRFEVRAEGMGNCDGVAATAIQVNPAPAPPASPAARRDTPSPSRILDMDTDRDGVVTHAEWRGTDQDFRNHDTNGDGVLSGAEVRDDWSEVIVPATNRWTRTGVYLREGDAVRIESAGTVQLSTNAADTSSPGGAGSGRRAASAPIPDRPAGALIARIGDGPAFFVGADSMVRANASGELSFGVNDDYLDDNRGEFRVKIAAPPQGSRRR